MGTCFYIACHDCKVYLDLDKFYALNTSVKTRKEALEFGERIKENHSFRAGLVISFLGGHMGHKVTAYSEHDTLYDEISDEEFNPVTGLFDNPDSKWKSDTNFWRSES